MLKSHFFLIVANILWGTSFIATKILLESIPPITIAVLRFFIATIVLYFYILFIEKDSIVFFKKDTLWTILLGFCGITIYYCAENLSLVYIPASVASLILMLIPSMTMILSVFVFDEQISTINWIGSFIAFIGVSIIILDDFNFDDVSISIGYVYILIAALSFSIYTVISKKILINQSPIKTTLFSFFWGTIFLIPLSIIELYPHFFLNISFITICSLLYLTIMCSIAAYFFWNIGLKYVESSKAGIYINIIPLTAVTLGVFILNEQVSFMVIGGGFLIIFGIYMTNFKNNKEINE